MPTSLSLFIPDEDDDDTVPGAGPSRPNFFADPDEDMEEEDPSPVKRKRDESEPVQRWATRSPARSASSPSVNQSAYGSEEDFEIEILETMPPKPQPSSPPSKKRRLSPELLEDPFKFRITNPSLRKSTYVGEMIIADAWATTSGKNLLANGDFVQVHCEAEESENRSKAKGNLKKDAGKQMTLTSMIKKKAPIPMKKGDSNLIVRFSNGQGIEVGRLPSKSSSWIPKVIANQVVDIQAVVVDCPAKVTMGCHIMLSLRFNIKRSVFIHPTESIMFKAEQKCIDLMSEGTETAQEQALSHRKQSLQMLFKAMSLAPHTNKSVNDVESALAFTKQTNPHGLSTKAGTKEIIGEGEDAEEIEMEGEELTGNQVNVIYQKAQRNDRDLPEMDPPDTFTLTLRPYQRQALKWMFSAETGSWDARESDSLHPLWEEYVFPPEPTEGVIDLCQDDEPFYFNPYSGELSLEFPRAERNCRGGILADGSLAITRHLCLSSPLVLVLSVRQKWKAELDRSSNKGTVNTYIYHGAARIDIDALIRGEGAAGQTVVITSYGTLTSEHAKTERAGNSSFYKVDWLRVVLDEAHYIKSRHTRTAKACYGLKAQHRWCLTGTPIVNRLEDLFSLLHFLRNEPWSDFAFFKSAIISPFLNQDAKCLDVVQIILESVLLRREKTMKDKDGRFIVSLPPKEVNIERLDFSSTERKIYDSVFAQAKHAYSVAVERGVVGKNMSSIFAMLMRLRRAVLHPSLIRRRTIPGEEKDEIVASASSEVLDVEALIAHFHTGDSDEEASQQEGKSNKFAIDVLKDLKTLEIQECPLCLDTIQDPVLIPECHHAGCKECFVEHLQDQEEKGNVGFCPVCQRWPVTERSLIVVSLRPDGRASNLSSPNIKLRNNDFVSSTKLDALIRMLRRLREQEPTFRAIVFSQFTGFLDLIQTVLRREDFANYRLDGQLSQKHRTKVLQDFIEPSDRPKIFVISLKAGGVGLNLTHANHVFMMDCWWNSAVEQQAIDRVHRIGQDKTVHVTHFIISATIEERILAIQKRKTAIVNGALGGRGKADPEAFENLRIMFEG